MICAGIADHRMTNASPRISSSRKTQTFTTIMPAVTTGIRVGRRDTSLKGIKPPTAGSSIPWGSICRTASSRPSIHHRPRSIRHCRVGGPTRRRCCGRYLTNGRGQHYAGQTADDHAHADKSVLKAGQFYSLLAALVLVPTSWQAQKFLQKLKICYEIRTGASSGSDPDAQTVAFVLRIVAASSAGLSTLLLR